MWWNGMANEEMTVDGDNIMKAEYGKVSYMGMNE